MHHQFSLLDRMTVKILILVTFAMIVPNIQSSVIFPQVDKNTVYEGMYRQLVKRKNLELIQAFNNDPAHSFGLGPNKFLSLDVEEFHSIYTMTAKYDIQTFQSPVVQGAFESEGKQKGSQVIKGAAIAKQTLFQQDSCQSINVDLTKYASPVKDQGACNSCYAHSAIATLESLIRFQHGISLDFSQQQITQCTIDWAPKGFQSYNNKGCRGGWGWVSMHYLRFLGVTLQQNYPYTSRNTLSINKCEQESIKGKRFRISGYQDYYNPQWPQSQCNILNQQLQSGKTVSVSIWAPKGIQYQFYGRKTQDIDLFDICGPYKSTNHQLQLVGSTDKYWKLKNSFGVQWGQKGYMYLDKSKGLNCMNVCMDFVYPTGLSTTNSYV